MSNKSEILRISKTLKQDPSVNLEGVEILINSTPKRVTGTFSLTENGSKLMFSEDEFTTYEVDKLDQSWVLKVMKETLINQLVQSL